MDDDDNDNEDEEKEEDVKLQGEDAEQESQRWEVYKKWTHQPELFKEQRKNMQSLFELDDDDKKKKKNKCGNIILCFIIKRIKRNVKKEGKKWVVKNSK